MPKQIINPKIKGFIICENANDPVNPKNIRRGRGGRGVIIETILQTANEVNRNRRLYTREALDSGLNASYIQERLRTFTWYGEMFHPVKPDAQRQMSYQDGKLSHIIEKYWWEGNILKGIVHSTFTACGDDFAGLVEQGCQVAFSMRGIGPIVEKMKDITKVCAPLHLFTYDTVVHPSHSTAYMTKILSEAGSPEIIVETATGNSSIFEEISPLQNSKFLTESSANFRLISENFELSEEIPTYFTKNRKYAVRESVNGDKIYTRMEDKLSEEIDRYLLKI